MKRWIILLAAALAPLPLFAHEEESKAGAAAHEEHGDADGDRTSIPAATARAAGVTTAAAGPAVIRDTSALLGVVALNENRKARVRARFPGLIREIAVGVGDSVRKGQTLAVVESNESLRSYAVIAPIDGIVAARDASAGDVAGTEPLFELADLSEVWVDLHAFGADVTRLASGQAVRVEGAAEGLVADAALDRVLPIAAPSSQSVIARVRLPNADGRWKPGLAVRAEVSVASFEVPLAVRADAVQTLEGGTVVFVNTGDDYAAMPVKLGRRDAEHVEVLSGIAAGANVVVGQSFLIKADIEKSGASHDH